MGQDWGGQSPIWCSQLVLYRRIHVAESFPSQMTDFAYPGCPQDLPFGTGCGEGSSRGKPRQGSLNPPPHPEGCGHWADPGILASPTAAQTGNIPPVGQRSPTAPEAGLQPCGDEPQGAQRQRSHPRLCSKKMPRPQPPVSLQLCLHHKGSCSAPRWGAWYRLPGMRPEGEGSTC